MISFLHIPRCGGTSLRKALRELPGALEWDHTFDQAGFEAAKDANPETKIIMAHAETCRLAGNIFTFLRDPIERVYSEYAWMKKSPYHQHYELANMFTLEQLLDAPFVVFDNLQTRLLGSCLDRPFGRVSIFDTIRALDSLTRFAFVGFTEDMDRSMENLFLKVFETPVYPALGRENETVKGPRDLKTDAKILARNEMDMAIYEEAKRRWA